MFYTPRFRAQRDFILIYTHCFHKQRLYFYYLLHATTKEYTAPSPSTRSRRVTSSYQRHAEPSRAVQPADPESGGGPGRRKKSGAALLAVAAKAEAVRAGLSQEVRQVEQAASRRAAAVAGVQQLLAQATVIVDSSAGLLLLPGAVVSAGGPQQGVSGVV
jgi:hypothetical protein